jgi:DNA-binding NarL/FixJ family response regulator
VEPIRILIVDDHPVFRQGVRDILETESGLEVIGEAADGQVALQLSRELCPDVVIMDINLPTMNGLQVTRRIKSEQREIKVIMLTGYDNVEQVFHAIRAGASAYCPKDILPDDLVKTIRTAHDGLFVVDDGILTEEQVQAWLQNELTELASSLGTDPDDVFMPLSPREMEILKLVTKGLSNKEIAYHLGISHQTVKNHMTSILRKLDVGDRTQAAVYALGRGWVRLEDARDS